MATSSKGARVAGGILCAGLGALALLQLAWALGMTWGLDEASGGLATDWSIGLSLMSLLVVVLCAAAIVVTMGRVGWVETRLSERALQIAAWLVFAALAFAVLVNLGAKTDWERFGNSGIALLLAIPAFVVARAHPRPHTGETPRPPITRAPVAH